MPKAGRHLGTKKQGLQKRERRKITECRIWMWAVLHACLIIITEVSSPHFAKFLDSGNGFN